MGPFARCVCDFKFSATVLRPLLLKPKRLMTARSCGSRNTRGFGFPDCGFGVTVPHSTKPKPIFVRTAPTSAFLSEPAAKPTGLNSFKPDFLSVMLVCQRDGSWRGPASPDFSPLKVRA